MNKTETIEKAATEIWRDVSGWEGRYQVSNTGRVKSLCGYNLTTATYFTRELIMTPVIKIGYATLKIGGKTVRVHRLVAAAFVPNPASKPHINHKNGLRNDNRVENLEWCTNQENALHACRVLMRKKTGGERCGEKSNLAKYKESDIIDLFNYLKNGGSLREFSNERGLNIRGLAEIARGDNWKHLGFDWPSVYKKRTTANQPTQPKEDARQ